LRGGGIPSKKGGRSFFPGKGTLSLTKKKGRRRGEIFTTRSNLSQRKESAVYVFSRKRKEEGQSHLKSSPRGKTFFRSGEGDGAISWDDPGEKQGPMRKRWKRKGYGTLSPPGD